MKPSRAGSTWMPTEAEGHPLPEALYELICEAYRALSERCGLERVSVAVRLPRPGRGRRIVLLAGQHATFLNVSGEEAVAAAVARCWRSAFSAPALYYRSQQGLDSGSIGMAVLVQQLLAREVSAVVFRRQPRHGRPWKALINASWGLGESIRVGSRDAGHLRRKQGGYDDR